MSAIINTQRRLARQAWHNPTHSFDHRYRRIGQEEWSRTALDAGHANQGAWTAGIDGMTKRTVATEEARVACTRPLRAELRDERFRPMPGRRVHFPKRDGKRRPRGLATLPNRVVQRVLEPLWEHAFRNGANGFRPRRRTMACLALRDSDITPRTKDSWGIDGDLKGAFDHIPQGFWWRLLAQRLADRHLLKLAAPPWGPTGTGACSGAKVRCLRSPHELVGAHVLTLALRAPKLLRRGQLPEDSASRARDADPQEANAWDRTSRVSRLLATTRRDAWHTHRERRRDDVEDWDRGRGILPRGRPEVDGPAGRPTIRPAAVFRPAPAGTRSAVHPRLLRSLCSSQGPGLLCPGGSGDRLGR
jgi:hypothetical protein